MKKTERKKEKKKNTSQQTAILNLRNKKTRIIIAALSILIIILAINTISKIAEYKKLGEEKILESYFIVSDIGGIGLIPGVVFFGRMTPGGSSTAKIYLNNTYNASIIAEIKAIGEIKEYFIEQKLLINPAENKEISLTVKIPLDIDFGEYRGKIVIKIKPII